MNNFFLEIPLYLWLFIGFYIITYQIGNQFLQVLGSKKKNNYFNLFFKSIIGFLIILFIYPLIKTKGLTVHSLLIIPFGYLIFILKNENKIKKNEEEKNIFLPYFLIPILLIFFFQTLYFYNPFTGIAYSLDVDNFYYANVGSFIQQIGKENRFLDWTSSEIAKPEIYHYADTWLVALFAEFNLPATKVITLVVNSFFYLEVYLGALAILEIFTEVNFFKSIYALLIFFISCIFINYNNFTFFGYGCVSLVYPKLAQITTFLILSYCFIINKQYELLVFSLLSFCIIYMALMPPTMIGLFLFIISLFVCKKINLKKALEFGTVLFIFSILFFILFKTVFSQIDSRFDLNGNEKMSLINTLISKFKDIVYTTIFNLKDFIIQILPYLILIIWTFLTNYKIRDTLTNLCFLSISLLVGGIIVFGLRYNFLDAIQFYQNLAYPITGILGFYLISQILFTQTNNKLIGFIIVFLLIFVNIYSSSIYINKMHQFNMVYNITRDKKYVQEVMKLVATEKKPRFAIAKGKDDYKTIYDKGIGIYLNPFIGNKINTYMPASITVFDIPLSEKVEYAEMEKIWITNSALNLYAQKHKLEKDTINLQIQFLKDNKIQFLEMAKNYKIPSAINEIIDTLVINPRNGVRFAKIKTSN